MKFKANFEEFKKAITTCGKGLKKGALLTPLIKIEAKEHSLIVSENNISGNGIGIEVTIPAAVEKTGSFVTSFYNANVLSVRNCTGALDGELVGNMLVLKYKNGLAKTVLVENEMPFNDVASKPADAASASIPLDVFSGMLKDTLFVGMNQSAAQNAYGMILKIEEDEDGLLKFSLTASDCYRIAKRTVFAVKNGEYTGSVVLAPENLKTVSEILDGENVEISVDGGKAYIKSGVVRCVFATLDKDMPNLEKFIAGRAATYSAEVDKSELLEALNCTIYLQKEKTQTVATLDFKTDSVSIGCPGLTDYAEVMSAKTNGEELGKKKVDSVFLKELASCYPGHTVMIASTSEASCPLWMCAGDHEEYVFCVLPINPSK